MRFPQVLFSLVVIVRPLPSAPSVSLAEQDATCVVSRIVDGDTFRCRDGRKVRLIGIDSPEHQQQPFGNDAREALFKMLAPGTAVWLQRDVAVTDRYGRLLAYAWVGPTFVNEAMVRDGWAVLYTVPPNIKYAEWFSWAQNEARARGTGLWARRGFECLPRDFRRRKCVNPP